MQPGKSTTVVKPTLDTQFHIDYDWWERENNELRAYMLTHLPAEMRPQFEGHEEFAVIDYIDPKTGEVHQYNELELALQEASKRDDFITLQTSLVDSLFRVFLANGNTPLTPKELEAQTGREARTILKTFGGLQIYRGIRPIQNS